MCIRDRGVVLLDRHLVEDHLEGGLRVLDRLLEVTQLLRAEHRPVRVVDRVEAALRHRIGQCGYELSLIHI